jgi:hypothetical protein
MVPSSVIARVLVPPGNPQWDCSGQPTPSEGREMGNVDSAKTVSKLFLLPGWTSMPQSRSRYRRVRGAMASGAWPLAAFSVRLSR